MSLTEDIPKKEKVARRVEFHDTFLKSLKVDAKPGKKPGAKEVRYTDVRVSGLTLAVIPASKNKPGLKRWYFRYKYAGKASMITLGEYPTVTLADARERARQAQKDLDQGINPSQKKRLEREALEKGSATFQSDAEQWLDDRTVNWEASHAKRNRARLENNIFPVLGMKSFNDLKLDDFSNAFKPIIARGSLETAQRICAMCIEILGFASRRGHLENANIIFALQQYKKKELPRPKRRGLPTITEPDDVGELLCKIQEAEGRQTYPVALALQLAPYVALRPSELVGGKWEEINLNKAEWYICEDRMKMGFDHVIPLPHQAVELIKRLKAFSGNGKLMFPSSGRGRGEHITTAALIMAIRRMKYQPGEFVTHGFRSMFSTIMNGNKTHEIKDKGFDLPPFDRDLIEIQLAHSEKDKIRKAYNRRDPYVRVHERRNMLQTYADLLDHLRTQHRGQVK
ncbi:integrase arm-type DNA-binding domain-containing protein [Desulfovibrio sp. OttesenSCG-928-I05]|nr:integrase arm-type DNA-binding domain-containing protein [Desulfovibrio sp. OttesenSCG-928-I05]